MILCLTSKYSDVTHNGMQQNMNNGITYDHRNGTVHQSEHIDEGIAGYAHERQMEVVNMNSSGIEARFALMESKIEELKAENVRLNNDLKNLAALLTEQTAHSHSSARTLLKSSKSSDSEDLSGARRVPHTDISCRESMGFERAGNGSHDKHYGVSFVETKKTRTSSERSVENEDCSSVGKVPQALLLRQLESIQNQLDSTKKQLTGAVRKTSFTKNNSVAVDGQRTNSAPLSVSAGRSASYSSFISPSRSINPFSAHSPTAVPFPLPMHDSVRRPGKILKDSKASDSGDAHKAGSFEKFWDLNSVSEDQFNAICSGTSDAVEKKKKSSRILEEESQHNLISAANRCREVAQRSPVNTDLSSALDKYLNVVRKLSASTGRTDTVTPDKSRSPEGLSNGLSRYGGRSSSLNSSLGNLSVENNRPFKLKEKEKEKEKNTTWRPSEGLKTPIGTNGSGPGSTSVDATTPVYVE